MEKPSISHTTFLKSGKDNLESPRPRLLEKPHLIKINIKKTKLYNLQYKKYSLNSGSIGTFTSFGDIAK